MTVPSWKTSVKLFNYCLTIFWAAIWHFVLVGFCSYVLMASTTILISHLWSLGDGLSLFTIAGLMPGGIISQDSLNISAYAQYAEGESGERDGVERRESEIWWTNCSLQPLIIIGQKNNRAFLYLVPFRMISFATLEVFPDWKSKGATSFLIISSYNHCHKIQSTCQLGNTTEKFPAIK